MTDFLCEYYRTPAQVKAREEVKVRVMDRVNVRAILTRRPQARSACPKPAPMQIGPGFLVLRMGSPICLF